MIVRGLGFVTALALIAFVVILAFVLGVALHDIRTLSERLEQQHHAADETLVELKIATRRDERALRILRCIVLIRPDARTPANVDDCILRTD